VIAGSKRLRVEEERDLLVDTAERRPELLECRREPFQVLRLALVTDVRIAGHRRGTEQTRGDPPDHDEAHAVTVQRSERQLRIEGIVASSPGRSRQEAIEIATVPGGEPETLAGRPGEQFSDLGPIDTGAGRGMLA
jgi:hypothetical protein